MQGAGGVLPDTGSRTLGLMLTELDLPLGENPARWPAGQPVPPQLLPSVPAVSGVHPGPGQPLSITESLVFTPWEKRRFRE